MSHTAIVALIVGATLLFTFIALTLVWSSVPADEELSTGQRGGIYAVVASVSLLINLAPGEARLALYPLLPLAAFLAFLLIGEYRLARASRAGWLVTIAQILSALAVITMGGTIFAGFVTYPVLTSAIMGLIAVGIVVPIFIGKAQARRFASLADDD